MKEIEHIGPLVPWCCTYYLEGVPYGITLWSTSSEQIESEWPGIKVDGRKIGEVEF